MQINGHYISKCYFNTVLPLVFKKKKLFYHLSSIFNKIFLNRRINRIDMLLKNIKSLIFLKIIYIYIYIY